MKKKYSYISKLLFGLLIISNMFGFPVIAGASGQEGAKDSEFEQIIKSIEDKYNVSITVDADAIDNKSKNLLDTEGKTDEILKSKNIEDALSKLTTGTNLQYQKLRKDYYIIKSKKEIQKEVPQKKNQYEGEKKTITGQVSQKKDGLSLPGVNVFVKGTTIGVATDVDGNYKINVPADATTLVFSFLGFKTIEVPINDQTKINVQLEEDVFGLEEVVVAGVASATPRRNLSVSVTKVNAKIIEKAPSSSAAGALQGKVAGVNIISANGQPGGGATIQIRGATSLRGNQRPLILMDGNILQTNLGDINMDDIESYEVVKGAAAAALYGSRAGNGVIVINTKRGKGSGDEKTSVVFREEIGFQKLAKQIDQATHHPYKLADDWQDYPYTRYDGIWYNDEGEPVSGNKILNNNDSSYADQPYARLYNHQDRFFEDGMFNTTYLSFMGSSKKSNFMISYERNRQQGILFETGGYTRNNLRLNLDHYVSNKIRISTSNLFLTALSDNPGSSSTFNDLLFIGPDVDLLEENEDGTPYKIKPDPWSIAENPLYPLANRDRTSKRMSFIGNVQAFWDIINDLTFNVKYAYEYRNKQWSTYTPKGYLGDYPNNINGSLYKEAFYAFDQNFQATLNYHKQINNFTGKLKLSYLYENTTRNDFSVLGKNFSLYDVPQLDWTDNTLAELDSWEEEIVAINYISILDMDYMDKYIMSLQYRWDGSSLFGEEERWHPFFRVSGAYRITEDFVIPGINELKVRLAYGNSGQRPGFSNQYETWKGDYSYVVPGTLGNKYLKPSVTTEFEAGLNMEFLQRFAFEFIYSNAITDGSIQLAPLPSQSGYPYQWQNVGTIQSDIFEATLSAKIFNKQNFNWDASLIFDRLRQKITEMSIPPYNTGPQNAFLFGEGETFAAIYGYKWLTSLDEIATQLPEGKTIDDYEINSDGYVIPKGTEGTNDEIPIELDTNNDGLPDKVEIGNGNPNFNLSLSNTFDFYGVTVYFLLSWKNGGEIYNFTRQYTFRDLRAIEFDQYDKPENEKKSINYYSTFYKNTEVNDYFIENGSFLKLREASVYYTFDEKLLGNIFNGLFKAIRIGIQAHNIFTISNYKGYDPEVASGRDLSNYPVDDFGYPNFRTFTGSIQVTF